MEIDGEESLVTRSIDHISTISMVDLGLFSL